MIKRLSLLSLVLALCISCLIPAVNAHALSGSQFQAGRIIDDGTFYNANTLNDSQIQAFLNAKVPTCDTNGAQASTHWYAAGNRYYTRAEWGALSGNSAPYTCLKNYSQSTPAKASDSYCAGLGATGSSSAAQIITNVARACSVNPEVILVLLQKEQALVTDDWPWASEYQAATGYGCPDTAACDSQYYGFFNQVYYGARQYQLYAKRADIFSFKTNRANNIQYNPNSGCGSSSVFLNNQSTTSLYNYTPYQPNTAALNNLYGTGDSCSAYGNRNFWRLFNDWFGSPYADCTYPASTGSEVFRLINPNTNSYMLTTDPFEVCISTGHYNYKFDGILLSSLDSSTGTPVYRLVKNGNYLYTTSDQEVASAVNSYGFALNGVSFYASTTATTASPVAVYRLSYPPTGAYAYTISTAERDSLVQSGFHNDGVSFYTNNQLGANLNDIYRLSNPTSGYLYTPSDDEKQSAQLGYGFNYEGVAFRSRVGFTVDDLPVYRLAGNHGYLLTTSFSERKYALSVGFRSEGAIFYAYSPDFLGATVQVYRLNHNGTYFYTSSAAERDNAVANYGYVYEGVAFRLP